MNDIECSCIMFVLSPVSSVSVFSEELSLGSGIDTLLRVLICGSPCNHFNTVSLQLIGIWVLIAYHLQLM